MLPGLRGGESSFRLASFTQTPLMPGLFYKPELVIGYEGSFFQISAGGDEGRKEEEKNPFRKAMLLL